MAERTTNGRAPDKGNLTTNWDLAGFEAGMKVVKALNDSSMPFRRGMSMDSVGRQDGRRNIDRDCGYPETEAITADMYQRLYDRSEIAKRVVDVMPKECWQVQPTLVDTGVIGEPSPLELGWESLSRMLNPGSGARSTGGSTVCGYLQRLDTVSRIGQYGVLLFGIDDGGRLDEEAEEGSATELLYLRVFPQRLATINAVEDDETSPRFKQPVEYTLYFDDLLQTDIYPMGTLQSAGSKKVHWTRVLHVPSDTLLSSEYLGVPECQVIYNRILDLYKMYGSCAEMYYLGAFFGLAFESLPDVVMAGIKPGSLEANKDKYEEFANGFQRALQVHGQTVKSIAPQVVDPTPQITRLIEAVCIGTDTPVPVFMGNDRGPGENVRWNDQVRGRQRNRLNPLIMNPFVDRLTYFGVLPPPSNPEGYVFNWPDLDSQTTKDKADVALKLTQALSFYTTSGLERIMPRRFYLFKIVGPVLGLTEEDVTTFLEAVPAEIEEVGDMMPVPRDRSTGVAPKAGAGEAVRGREEPDTASTDGQPVGPVGNIDMQRLWDRFLNTGDDLRSLTGDEMKRLKEEIAQLYSIKGGK